jgi:DNA modification methylase
MRREQIGDATLYCGDCREIVPTIAFDVVVTDPPYGVAFSSGWNNKFRGIKISGDHNTEARDAVLSMTDCPALVFGSRKAPLPDGVKQVLIWDKGTVGMGDISLPWFPCTEEIYVIGSGWVGTRTSAVLRHISRNEYHPTEKPVSLLTELLQKCDKEWAVLDPFMGSGSTGVACSKSGRAFVGIELNADYFETACRRITEAYAQPDMFIASPPQDAAQERLML